jgi:hypothetical protein
MAGHGRVQHLPDPGLVPKPFAKGPVSFEQEHLGQFPMPESLRHAVFEHAPKALADFAQIVQSHEQHQRVFQRGVKTRRFDQALGDSRNIKHMVNGRM